MLRSIGLITAIVFWAGQATAATLAPSFFMTAYDQGNNGYGVAATGYPYPIATPNDFTLNFLAAPVLLRGSVGAQTPERRGAAFFAFNSLSGSSVSSATLTFYNGSDFTINTGSGGVNPATPNIKVTALTMSPTLVGDLPTAFSSSGIASTVFTSLQPINSRYDLDLTSLVNSALPSVDASNHFVLRFDIDEPFSGLPNGPNNAGYGNVSFKTMSLDFATGPAPTAVPIPASGLLLMGSLGLLGALRRRRRA